MLVNREIKVLIILLLLISVVGINPNKVQADIYNSYYNNHQKVIADLPSVKDINICIIDDFNRTTHGVNVTEQIEKFFSGNIIKIDYIDDFELMDYTVLTVEQKTTFSKCDVINYSMWFPTTSEATKEYIKYVLNRMLSENDIILVNISGNSETLDSVGVDDHSLIGMYRTYKTDEEEVKFAEKTILVGQLKPKLYTGYWGYSTPFALSKTIDILVPNWGELHSDGLNYYGTSFSAPVISGVVGRILEAGVDKKDVKGLLNYGELYNTSDFNVGVLDVEGSYNNAKKYIDNLYASGVNVTIPIR